MKPFMKPLRVSNSRRSAATRITSGRPWAGSARIARRRPTSSPATGKVKPSSGRRRWAARADRRRPRPSRSASSTCCRWSLATSTQLSGKPWPCRCFCTSAGSSPSPRIQSSSTACRQVPARAPRGKAKNPLPGSVAGGTTRPSRSGASMCRPAARPEKLPTRQALARVRSRVARPAGGWARDSPCALASSAWGGTTAICPPLASARASSSARRAAPSRAAMCRARAPSTSASSRSRPCSSQARAQLCRPSSGSSPSFFALGRATGPQWIHRRSRARVRAT
ncbi:hypothetical protein D9M70_410120 [compost metagenome]